MFSLKNKVIVISGGSSGIGRQCAISCSQNGAKVVILGRNENKLKETLSLLEGEQHLYFVSDLRETDKIEDFSKTITKELGLINGFIHSAGLQITIPLRLHSKEIYHNQFEINVVAGFEISRILTKKEYFSPAGGSIIFISSIKAFCGSPNLVGYSTTKGAVISGAKAMAIEVANRRIRVNTVSPGMVEDTDMTMEVVKRLSVDWVEKNKSEYPLGWVNSIDIANACIFLLSDESIKVTGTNFVIDGGFSAK